MRKSLMVFIVAVVLMSMATGCGKSGNAQKNDGSIQTVTVTRRDMSSSVLATGIIKPMVGAEVRVGSRASGTVQHLHVNIGDMVTKGQVLAELDPAELQAENNQAKAALENARANYEYAKLDLKRQHSLLKQNFISQNQLDLAEKSFEINKAKLKQAEANLAYAGIQLNYTKIIAPISGVIASVSTQEGETVTSRFSAPTFVTIINLKKLEVWAYVDETDIGRVDVGQRSVFTVDTYPATDFEGVVTAIYPKAVIQDNVVNYVTTIKITNFKGKTLRPEMTATVTIFLQTRKNVLAIPRKAVHNKGGEKFVTVLDGDAPQERKVTLGWKNSGFYQVTGGLKEGEKIEIQQ
ncbi:MAG TPA: efflux RND transporter periplasmic adaptor subunit [Bacteroidetes bacterium]|nr:efflux RND transporter periplasmic adaptor subunit [Bacteroidota bacterium]